MKSKIMMVLGAAAGVGMYMGISKLSQNRNKLKRRVNTIIDDAADMFE